MKRMRHFMRLAGLMLSAMLVSLVLFGAYSIMTEGNRWFSSLANTYVRQQKAGYIPGAILDRQGVVLATTNQAGQRIYHTDPMVRSAMVHVLGDRENNVGNGAEQFFASYLYGFDTPYHIRLSSALRGEKILGNHVQLTVDAGLMRYIASIFPKDKKGAVVVMNYKTGEVLALNSFPNFDPDGDVKALKTDRRQPFWNNATKWTTAPGSTFKMITLASALENLPDVAERTFSCTGEIVFEQDMTRMHDANDQVHGELSLEKAFQASCNIVFGSLAMELGDEKLKKTAAAFGVDDYFLFSDVVLENSHYPKNNRTQKELAWTGVGQSALQITPMHMAMMAGAIANDGVMMEPLMLKAVANRDRQVSYEMALKGYRQAVNKQTADTIAAYMNSVVRRGTGTAAQVPGVKVCGKTGTAEVDGQKESNAWFIGFMDDERYPYALSVVVMDAGGGGKVAAPLAGQIFSTIVTADQ